MAIATTSLFMVDEGEFYRTGQTQYGPLTIGGGFVLTKMEVRAHISYKSAILNSSPTYAHATHIFGVQWGFSGYTPYDFNTAAELDGHTWLFGEAIAHTGESVITWAPSTDDANYISTYQFHKTMFFQGPPHELGRDHYLSVADQTAGVPVEYRIFGVFRLWYE